MAAAATATTAAAIACHTAALAPNYVATSPASSEAATGAQPTNRPAPGVGALTDITAADNQTRSSSASLGTNAHATASVPQPLSLHSHCNTPPFHHTHQHLSFHYPTRKPTVALGKLDDSDASNRQPISEKLVGPYYQRPPMANSLSPSAEADFYYALSGGHHHQSAAAAPNAFAANSGAPFSYYPSQAAAAAPTMQSQHPHAPAGFGAAAYHHSSAMQDYSQHHAAAAAAAAAQHHPSSAAAAHLLGEPGLASQYNHYWGSQSKYLQQTAAGGANAENPTSYAAAAASYQASMMTTPTTPRASETPPKLEPGTVSISQHNNMQGARKGLASSPPLGSASNSLVPTSNCAPNQACSSPGSVQNSGAGAASNSSGKQVIFPWMKKGHVGQGK